MNQAIGAVLRPFWRLSRGLTLGTRGCIIDAGGKILLIRHGYQPGWHFPGGGVEWGETLEMALARELKEEAGVEMTGRPELHGVFANFAAFPGDHVAVFVVRQWQRSVEPAPNLEIAASGLFAPDAMPLDTTPSTRRRLSEILDRQPPSQQW